MARKLQVMGEFASPSNWNAAEGEPGHVLNRTHWVESGMVEILPETTVALEGGEGMISGNIGLEDGKTYIVNWNGAEYEIVATWSSELNGTCVIAPDDSFLVGDMPEVECVIIGGSSALTSVTLSISQKSETIHKLPGKFLPDGVPYVEKGFLLEETDAVESTDPTFGKCWTINKAPSLTIGETYTVIYNSMPYDCVCQPGESLGMSIANGGFIMGNLAAAGGANTGEPFAMLILPAYQMIINLDLTGAASVRIGIMGKVGHKIDDRCIPDSARVLVVKFAEREDGNLVSTSHTYQQIRTALLEGVPVVCTVRYSDRDGASTAIFGCQSGDSWIMGSHAYTVSNSAGETTNYVGEYWYHAWEYPKYYLDGDTSNRTIGNELWLKN